MVQVKELLCRIQDSFHAISPEIVQRYPNRRMDIAYAPDNDSQKLDIWYPNGWDGSPLPVILMLHGGAFQHGDKYEDTREPMLRGLDRGYAVVSANYRLAPEGRFPSHIYDGKRAIRFLRANAASLGLDPTRIALWGYSSGGWLVSMIGVTAGNPAFRGINQENGEQPDAVQAVICSNA